MGLISRLQAGMPISHKIDKERRRVFFRIWGEFSSADIIDAITQALTDPDFRPGYNVLSDHTGVTRVIQRDQIEATTNVLNKFQTALSGARWAMVVGESDYHWGMLRMLSGLSSGVPVEAQTFREEAAAVRWLEEAI